MEWAGTQTELEEYVDRLIADHDKRAFAIMHRIADVACGRVVEFKSEPSEVMDSPACSKTSQNGSGEPAPSNHRE